MLEFRAKGTINELEQLFNWDLLSKMISVDFYKKLFISTTEQFTITEQHLAKAGIIPRNTETYDN